MPQNPTPSTLLVTQIKAGQGVSVTPEGGSGIVTIAVSGSEAPTAITGGANPFPITGKAPASATSAGGEVDVAGGVGGATSGAGGPAKLTGGAASAGNSAGGAAPVAGGAGSGSAAGGAASITGGVGGATGNGGAASVAGGAAGATSGTGGTASVTGGASPLAGSGGPAELVGGVGGTTSGNGGQAQVTGGAAGAGSNGNGGDVVLTGGAQDGSGVAGNVVNRGTLSIVHQGTPYAATTSALLTAADILTGIITVLQGGGANSAQQLPLATAMDTAIPNAVANDAIDFSVINLSTSASETASITTNTGWTLVGSMSVDIQTATSGATPSAGRFRARKTGTGAWTLYRLS